MVMNVDNAIQQQTKAEHEAIQILKERQAVLNHYFVEDPKTYVEKYRQHYAKEILGSLAESLIAQCTVGKYQITFVIPFEINQRSINVKILSWSKMAEP
jgi:hypothetical protein